MVQVCTLVSLRKQKMWRNCVLKLYQTLNDWPPKKQWVLFSLDPWCSVRWSRRKHWGSRGNKTPCFLWGQSLSALLYLPTNAGSDTNLLWFQVTCANPVKSCSSDHVWVKSSSCCFPKELVTFDVQHVTWSDLHFDSLFELAGITMLVVSVEHHLIVM